MYTSDQTTRMAYHSLAQAAGRYDRELKILCEELIVDDRNATLLHELLDLRIAAHKAILLSDALVSGLDIDYSELEVQLLALEKWKARRRQVLSMSVCRSLLVEATNGPS